jgi:CheY-like chemotaxis protein
MNGPGREAQPRILCVDDEPLVLDGLGLRLRKTHEVLTATSGTEGLRILEETPDIAVVLSDMRMPVMDGAEFLTRARALRPDAVRMLLTGYADIEVAMIAVNEAEVFRFLIKPCPPVLLLRAFEAALHQHRLVTAERALLEETLAGTVRAVVETFALGTPAGFGRAARIRQSVRNMATVLRLPERWHLELAAVFSQLGGMGLEPGSAVRWASQLVSPIPRLERVEQLVASLDSTGGTHDVAEDVLRVAVAFETLVGAGKDDATALEMLRRREVYDPAVLEALVANQAEARQESVHEVPLRSLAEGMRLLDDVRLADGTLVLGRGYEVSTALLLRLPSLAPDLLARPVRVSSKARSTRTAAS